MNIITRMDSLVTSYTATDRRIYEGIKKFPDRFANDSIHQLVEALGISQSALTRFAKKLGFSGFLEFQYQFSQEYREVKTHSDPEKLSERFSQFLQNTENALDPQMLQTLAQRIINARMTYFTGASIAGLPARYIGSFCRLGMMISGVFSSPDDLPLCFAGDEVLLLYSAISGDSYRSYLSMISHNGCKPYIVIVTMNAKHPLRKYADQTIVLPEAGIISDNTSAMPETMEFMMFTSLLIEHIQAIDSKKNTPEQAH